MPAEPRTLDTTTADGARIVFGPGAEARTAEVLAELGAERVLLVALGHHRDGADRIAAALGDRCAGVFADAQAQVPVEVAEAARVMARDTGADWVLAHGGGSAIGVAKAVALADDLDVRVGAVATTYAGSERTNIWGITTDGLKTTGRDDRVLPRLVVYDPELTVGLPVGLSQQSLLNALAHSVEALYAVEWTQQAREAARDSLVPLVGGLRRLSRDPTDRQGRSDALYGAYLAATALGGASIALHHKLAHVLGGSFGTAHALTHSVLLPYTMGFNLPAAPEARAALRPALGDDPPGALYDLMRDLGVPTKLPALEGPSRDDLDRVVELALQKTYPNPREITADGLRELLHAAWHDRRPSLHTTSIPMDGREPLSLRGALLERASHAVFGVHGRGACVDRLLPDFQRRVGRPYPSVAWIGPQAVDQAWYPKGFRRPLEDNQPHFDEAIATLDAAWATLTAHVDPENVLVTGFSQGCCLVVTWLGMRGIRPKGVVLFTGAHLLVDDLDFSALDGVPVYLGTAADDPWVTLEQVEQTAALLRDAGARVTLHATDTDQHGIHPADDQALRRAVEDLMGDDLQYQTGFGNALASEAEPGALPQHQNGPREVPYGLFSEQINGTGFTVERALNRRTWMYRLHPTVHRDATWERIDGGRFVGRFDEGRVSPQIMRFRPTPPPPDAGTDWLAGISTFAGAGDPAARTGMAIHVFAANADMERVFANVDGDLLIVPWEGALRIQTELGWLHVGPGEIAIVPRALRFRVTLPDGQARGWLAETFGGHIQLPERGPVGANGMADERHFEAPVAAYEDAGETIIVHRQGGDLWQQTAPHSPFDVVAWHGTYAPFKYDLRDFNSLGSVSFDHPDPSILTVLSCPIDTHGRSSLDVAVFLGRWDVMEHSFRPPFFHRNSAVEFNGVVSIPANDGPWQPGTFSYTPYLSPHAVSGASYNRAIAGPDAIADRPERGSDDSIWIQFESTYPLRVQPWWVDADNREDDYLDGFDGYQRGTLVGKDR